MKFQRAKDTIFSQLEDQVVLMDIDKGSYFTLNPVGAVIWNLLETPYSLEDLVEKLMGEFEVDLAQCRQETEDYLQNLLKMGLVEKIE